MGNAEFHDLINLEEFDKGELDLSNKFDYQTFCKHINGEYSDKCLTEVPWNIRDSISLFKKINMSFNCLKTLPSEIPFRLPHLSYINLNYNQIEALPESISLLFHLKEIQISHNHLQVLPTSFCNLLNLEKIDLSNNMLDYIPENFGEMKSLVKLNVSCNKLRWLPKSLGLSKTLCVLLAVGNLCESLPPQSVCDKGSEPTLRYLRKIAYVENVVANSEISRNIFTRIHSNQVQTSVPDLHSSRAQYVQVQTETVNTPSRIRTPLMPPYGATTLQSDILKDRIIGLIYGAVIGDALGVGTEFLSPDECKFHYDENNLNYDNIIRDEHRMHWTKACWTSNSDQMFIVLDSLLSWAGVIDELDFAQRIVSWRKKGFSGFENVDRYIFSTVINLVLQDENYILNPHHIASNVYQKGSLQSLSNGVHETKLHNHYAFSDNGALSRAIILGIPHFHDLNEVVSNSLRICEATHFDQKCRAACVTLSVLIALMLQGKHSLEKNSSVDDLLNIAREHGKQQIDNISYQEEFDKLFSYKTFEKIHLNEVGKLSCPLKSLSVAFTALQQQRNFQTVLSSLLMQGGHGSMNGCIAGALLGCKCGYSQLPKNWIEELQLMPRQWLNNKINALLDMMGLP